MTKIQELELVQSEIRFYELKIEALREKEKELLQSVNDRDFSKYPYLPVGP